jgi:hypothetical protein
MTISAPERKKLIELILAMVNLYGIAPYAKVAEVWHREYPRLTPVTEDFLSRMRIGGEFFEHTGDAFAHESLFWDGAADFYDLLKQQENKPYFEPPLEELLKHEDDMYYEKTPAFAQLLQFVQKERLASGKTAFDLVDDIQLLSMDMGASLQEVMGEFERRNIVFKNNEQVGRLLPLLTDLTNNTRIRANRGFTPLEMIGRHSSRTRTPAASGKTGRNDPCPCGSGKKFKNCCGK